METYFIKKQIDWSVLNQGFSIPVTLQERVLHLVNKNMKRGDRIRIDILYGSNIYHTDLVNQAFDEDKYTGHASVLQIRYNAGSKICKMLRIVFRTSYDYLLIEKAKISSKKQIKFPDSIKEFFALYQTSQDNVFRLETFTASEVAESLADMVSSNELEIERNFKSFDENACVIEDVRTLKIRKLDYSIIHDLKRAYHFKCQICRVDFLAQYNVEVCEGHHIDYFSQSFNNDYSNIIILCPNHHSVIHKDEPLFHRKQLLFEYKNGFKEKILDNVHL